MSPCLCVKVCVLCAPVGVCLFTHTPGNQHHCVCVTECVSPCPVPNTGSKHSYSSSGGGRGCWPQLESHTFSRTNDFYQNHKELMTHGGPWALEGSQRRTTGDTEFAWSLGAQGPQKAHSSPVQRVRGWRQRRPRRCWEQQYSQPGLHSLLRARARAPSLSLSL